MKKILITIATIAMSAVFALAGAGTAQANDDGLCWNGWIWSACVSGPGWVDWNPAGGTGTAAGGREIKAKTSSKRGVGNQCHGPPVCAFTGPEWLPLVITEAASKCGRFQSVNRQLGDAVAAVICSTNVGRS